MSQHPDGEEPSAASLSSKERCGFYRGSVSGHGRRVGVRRAHVATTAPAMDLIAEAFEKTTDSDSGSIVCP